MAANPLLLNRSCACCGLESKMCCPCRAEKYCGVSCQNTAWGKHKLSCTIYLHAEIKKATRNIKIHQSEDPNNADNRELCVLLCQMNLRIGSLYERRGKMKRAEKACHAAKNAADWSHDADDIAAATASSLDCIGHILIRQAKYGQARKNIASALEIKRKLPAREGGYPDVDGVAASLNRLGVIDYRECKFDAALVKFGESLKLYEADPSCDARGEAAVVLGHLGILHMEMGNTEDGIRVLRSALEIKENTTPLDISSIASTLINLAGVYITAGLCDDALKYLERALESVRKVHGDKSVDAAHVLSHMAACYIQQKEYGLANKVCEKVLKYQKKHLGRRHIEVGASMSLKGCIRRAEGRIEEAVSLLEEAKNVYQEAGVDDHVHLANICMNLTECYYTLKNIEQVETNAVEVCRIHEVFKLPGTKRAADTARGYLQSFRRDHAGVFVEL
jgi:tetratricopeptide (TPR) repeat protein